MQTCKCERLRTCEHKFDSPGQTIYHDLGCIYIANWWVSLSICHVKLSEGQPQHVSTIMLQDSG